MDDKLTLKRLLEDKPTVKCTSCNHLTYLEDIVDTIEFSRGEFKCSQCGRHDIPMTFPKEVGPLPFSKQNIFLKPLPINEQDIFIKPVFSLMTEEEFHNYVSGLIGQREEQDFATKKVSIAKIENGIVIDHIPAGKAFLISKILGLAKLADETGDIIVLGVNFESPTMTKKDVIKVENLSLTRDMLRVVSLIAPRATVARIQNGKVVEKYAAEIPSVVNDIVVCPDRSCITRHEEIPGHFLVLKTEPLTLKCQYCEIEFYGALIRYKEGLRSWESIND